MTWIPMAESRTAGCETQMAASILFAASQRPRCFSLIARCLLRPSLLDQRSEPIDGIAHRLPIMDWPLPSAISEPESDRPFSLTRRSVYTTTNGVPMPHPYMTQRAGVDGPLLLQDFHLIDLLSHFDRER